MSWHASATPTPELDLVVGVRVGVLGCNAGPSPMSNVCMALPGQVKTDGAGWLPPLFGAKPLTARAARARQLQAPWPLLRHVLETTRALAAREPECTLLGVLSPSGLVGPGWWACPGVTQHLLPLVDSVASRSLSKSVLKSSLTSTKDREVPACFPDCQLSQHCKCPARPLGSAETPGLGRQVGEGLGLDTQSSPTAGNLNA